MSRFVRQSKFRHVFGAAAKAEVSYTDLRPAVPQGGFRAMACSNLFFAMPIKGGGGCVFVSSYDKTGKQDKGDSLPRIAGHKSAVLDLAFSPFNDALLATSSDDCYVRLWAIPEGGLDGTIGMDDATQLFTGHRHKVTQVRFNPAADNVLASANRDQVFVWDVPTGEKKLELEGDHNLCNWLAWDSIGAQIATTWRDKHCRVGDPRTSEWAQQFKVHQSTKASSCVWLKDGNLFTVGFNMQAQREYMIWDPRNTEKSLVKTNIDSSSGVMLPYYDEDTSLLYLAGKGDGNIRYYEYTGADKLIYHVSDFKSAAPLRGGAMKPKTACNVSNNEVASFMKLEADKVTPISFTVPRKSDLFQDDLFPETSNGAGQPGTSNDEWFAGTDKLPGKVSLEGGFVAKPKAVKVQKVVEEKKLTPVEMQAALEKANKRIAYLETELKKRDVKIAELEKGDA